MLGWSVVLAAKLAAPAEVAPVDLAWTAPAGCPVHDEVVTMVQRFVSAAPRPEGWRARAEARVEQVQGQWVLTLRMRFPEGEVWRSIDGESCAVVAEGAALIVSVLLDPQAVLAEIEASGPPREPVVEPVEEAPAPSEPDVEPVPSPVEPRVRGTVGFAGLAAFGVLPRIGFAPSLSGSVERGALRAELRTTFDIPQSAFVADTSGGARISFLGVAALGCVRPEWNAISLPLCAGPELGWLRARGEGLQQPFTVHRLLVDLQASAAFAYAVRPRLRLRLQIDGLVPLTPHAFVVADLGEAHRTRPVAMRTGLGLEVVL
ncbi:MAG: hypothetical protein AAF799_44195 [Myxococcota bacterium]